MSGAVSIALYLCVQWIKNNKHFQSRFFGEFRMWLYAGLIFFAFSSFRVWKSEHEQSFALKNDVQTLQNELADLNKPQLRGTILGQGFMPGGEHNKDLILLVGATIENSGAPSIAKNIMVTLGLNGVHHLCLAVIETPEVESNLLGQKGGLRFRREDALELKASLAPIPHNGAVSGHMFVYVDGVTIADAHAHPEAVVTLLFKGINGRDYSARSFLGRAQRVITTETFQPEYQHRKR